MTRRGYFRPPVNDVLAHKTGDQNSSDGTNLVDVNDLTWAVEAGGVYILDGLVMALAAATTTGLALALNGPASPTIIQYATLSPVAATSTNWWAATTYDTALVATGSVSTANPYPVRFNAFLVNGVNAGTLALRFRTEVDTSQVTIKRGSWGRLTRVG